jgi:hypothetical protein
MARDDLPKRPRELRTGETPEPPQEARADDPTHGVDPYKDRPDPPEDRPAPGARPGLMGEEPHRGAMQTAERGPARRRAAPAIWLAVLVVAIFIAAALYWA